MKTPYDTAMRVRQRDLDEVSAAIRREARELGQVEREQARMRAAVRDEALLATADVTLISPGWQRRVQNAQQSLSDRQAELQHRLEALREVAIDGYGVLRGIETAAQDYRADLGRKVAAAEQATSDDMSAAAFLKTLRIQRRRASGD
ncbi:hypothetical protein AB3M93_15265 [Novosphingobium panipatense]|uniref:hypothetical protein n=1 Tax=Novosphingobium panipatense TaxID=428991 RepID=UPI0039A2BFD8